MMMMMMMEGYCINALQYILMIVWLPIFFLLRKMTLHLFCPFHNCGYNNNLSTIMSMTFAVGLHKHTHTCIQSEKRAN